MAADRYTPQQLAEMARRLDECIEVSALCMSLELAGEQHRRAHAEAVLGVGGVTDEAEASPGAE